MIIRMITSATIPIANHLKYGFYTKSLLESHSSKKVSLAIKVIVLSSFGLS
jgi:hypothetical protein